MNDLDAVKSRHSVRKFLNKKIETEKIQAINDEIESINKESGLSIKLFADEPVAFDANSTHYGRFACVSNYIAMIGEKDKDFDEKVGYYGEKLVILAQKLGLNTCWVGMSLYYNNSQMKPYLKNKKLGCVIALGYGQTQGVMHVSRPIEKVTKTKIETAPKWFEAGVEAALLAPTAMNQQKFKFELVDKNKVKATTGRGFFAKTDLGIAKYHFEIGAGKLNFEWA